MSSTLLLAQDEFFVLVRKESVLMGILDGESLWSRGALGWLMVEQQKVMSYETWV